MRPLAPDAAKLDLDELNKTPLPEETVLSLVWSAAAQVALLHQPSNPERAIQRDLATRPPDWPGDAAQRMSGVITREWQDFVEAHTA